jgi:tRNA nucleotidyltransferase (CCA-adding enzyme)
MAQLGLDRAIHPYFGLQDEALAQRALELLPSDAAAERLVISLVGQSVPQVELSALLDELAFEAADRDAILAATAGAAATAEALAAATRPSQIAAAVDHAGPELVALAGALGPAQVAREWLTRLRHIGLAIDGDDLLAEGIPRGPAVGRGLRAALAAKLDGWASGREEELAEALRAARATGSLGR